MSLKEFPTLSKIIIENNDLIAQNIKVTIRIISFIAHNRAKKNNPPKSHGYIISTILGNSGVNNAPPKVA
jgi:hypothetical protein